MQTGAYDPRAKLLTAFFLAGVVVITRHAAALAVEYAILLLLVVCCQKGKAYLAWLKFVLPMSLFFGLVTWWSATLLLGLTAAVKLMALTTVFYLFFTATAPEELSNALVKAGMPYAIAFVMSTALQFVPVINRKARLVIEAQRSRGIPLEPGWSALRYYPAFFIPLLIQAFQLAEELAETMEARGFGRPGRSFQFEYRFQNRDWGLIMAGATVFAAGLVCRFIEM
jgi:energy-coupling factor transport system permease protein